MLEKKPAKSAAATPKAKAGAAPRTTEKTVATPRMSTIAGEPASAKRRNDDMHERIQRRAYELWESEGRPTGREHDNWLQAEREIARTRSQRVGMSR